MALINQWVVRVGFLACLLATTMTGQETRNPLEKSRPATVQKNDRHTSVTMLADVGSVKPGSRFTVGVLMKMEKGWHTYWVNPGEAGLPTQIEWTLPKGFVAGDIQWPLPNKFIESGEVVTYGYSGETMLLVPVTAPPSLIPGSTVSLKANVRWLECERICVPASSAVQLSLSVSALPTSSGNLSLIEKYRRRVPQSLSLSQGLILTRETKAGSVNLTLTATEGDLVMSANVVPDFYPESLNDIVVGRTQVTGGGRSVTLRIPLSAYQSVTGPLELKGVLVYQVRNRERMAGTVSIPLSKEFCATIALVAERDSQGQKVESSGSLLDREFSPTVVGGSGQPFFLYIIYAILGGLLLNIMPCVLPVIGLKVFGLLKMSGDQPRQVMKLGWFFSLGILASFLALALVVIILKAASEQVGWGFQFQEPLFVVIMSAVVFAFGLSLFGVYEIQVPGTAVARVGSVVGRQEKKGKGYLASFGEGVFATILATPCTAPILGTALGFAFAQPPGVTLLIFACTALGMALPYLLLTFRPAWMKFLPKPGEWMVSAKQFMGFLMMATLLWLLYILGKQLGMEAVIWTGAFLLVVGVSCWLIGRFATLTATRVRYTLTWVVAALLVILGYVGFVAPLLEARTLVAADDRNEVPVDTGQAQEIQWRPFSLAKLDSYLRENKTVFIDFTAEWCLTCKLNEKTVMADMSVIEKFRSTGIVAVRADWTNRNPEIARLLSKFGRSGVPLYVILPADRPHDPIVLPEVITAGIVLDAIDRAFASTSAAQPQ